MSAQSRLIACFIDSLFFVCVVAGAAQAQSGAVRRVTNTPEQALSLNPTISGDGKRIAFETTENLAGAQGGNGFRALVAQFDGPVPVFAQVALSRAPAPAVSQDGARVAFASTSDLLAGGNVDGNSEIFFYDGGQLRQITNTVAGDVGRRVQQGNFMPSISDNGNLIAFVSNRDLTGANADANLEVFIYDVVRQSWTQVTDTAGIVGMSSPKLSGDGSCIAFIRDRRADTDEVQTGSDLLLYDLRANQTRVLREQVRGLSLTPGRAISDDGGRIVYAAETAANTTQVFIFDGHNEATRQLTSLGARVTDVPLNPTISGDGARVAFATRRNVVGGNGDGSVELYLYDLPTNRFTRLTNAPAQATAEVISSLADDGAVVAFNFPRVLSGPLGNGDLANNSEIYTADIEARPPFASDLQVAHAATLGREPAAVKAVAPDQIAIATGRNLALVTAQMRRQADGKFPSTHANVTLSVNGRPAELLYVSPAQINFVVPPNTEPGAGMFAVRNHDGYETRGTFNVLPAAPGVFTETGNGAGQCLALDATTFLRLPFDPVDEQDNPRRLIVFATGVRHARELVVTMRGTPLIVESLAPAPELPGLDEIHVVLTRALRGAGLVPLVVRADGRESNATTIHIGGVRRAASIVLMPTSARLGIGRTLRFVARVLDEAGVEIAAAPVVFSSSAPEVASVDADGTVRGLRAGTVTIRAVSDGSAAAAQLQIYPLTLLINEVLVDPPDGAAGDANHDGVRSAAQDEFIEIVNAADQDVALGGYQLFTRTSAGNDTLRHTFTADTILSPGTALVVFGGAQTATFNPINPVFGGAQIFTASTGGLSLLNGGSTVTLLDASGALVEQMTYGDATSLPGDRAQSLTRAPDVTGDYALHQQLTATEARAYSPGTRTNAAPFNTTAPIEHILLEPASAEIEIGAQQQFNARAFDASGRELNGVLFQWQTSDATVATINHNGLARGLVAGTCNITTQARGVRSAPAPLNVRESPPVLTRIEVAPAALTLPAGVQQQFGARAFDQRGQEMRGVAFTWTSSDPNVAAIDQAGLTDTRAQGTTTISAAAQGVAGSAVLDVSAPLLVINEVLADPPDGAAGDANHDGTRSGTDDEFIELVNTAPAPLDLGAWTLRTHALNGVNETTRHTFATGTMLQPGDAIVVFGGGTFAANEPAFGGAQVVPAASGGLSFSNAGLFIIVRDGAGRPAAQFAYGTANDDFGGDAINQSLTRAPDGTGSYTRHTLASGADTRRFSPGTKLDGSFFAPRAGRLTRVVLAPLSATLTIGSMAQFTAQAIDQFDRPLPGVAFTFTSSEPNVAAVTDEISDDAAGRAIATVTGRDAGTAQLVAAATDGMNTLNSDAAMLTVNPLPAVPVAGQVIINEALVAFATSSTQPRSDFVELYNTTEQTLDISGLIISFRPAGSANTPNSVTLPGAVGSRTTLIEPHGYFLVANGPNTFGVAADFAAPNDIFNLNNTTGGIKLEIDDVQLDGLTYQGGSAAPAPPFNSYGEGRLMIFTSTTTNDLIRSPNATDTNNNATDFRRNSATASVTPRAANP